jgi:large repetitive protein
MLNHRTGLRGIVLIALLAGGALLEAQVPTPHISSLASGIPTDGCLSGDVTNGPAITVGTPGTANGLCLFINGNFNANDNETVTWTDPVNKTVTLDLDRGVTAGQLVALVPPALLAVALNATIQVIESPPESPAPVNNPSNTVTFTVNPAMAGIAVLPSGIVGVAYSQPFFSGGTPGANGFTVTAPNFPPGLGYTNTSGYLLTGTPTVAVMAFPVSVTITDSWRNVLNVSETITIFNPLLILTTSLPAGRINTAYVPTTLAASNGAAPLNWSATGLPTGMTLNALTGTLSGTPTQSGNFTVNVTLTDQSPQVANASLALQIVPTLVIPTATLPNGIINTAYTATTLAAIGGLPPYNNWTATGGLPIGMTLSAGGVLSGTPTVSGSFTVSVTLMNSGQTALGSFPLLIAPTLVIPTATLPNGIINTAYTATTLAATGGLPPYNNWTATGGLPTGMTLSAAGVLSGTPTVSGSFTVSVTLMNGGQTALASFPLLIVPTLLITTNTLPNGRINTPYTLVTLAKTGGLTPYTWTATGLPAGLTLTAGTGMLSGTPTVSGPFTVAVTLTDNSGQTAHASFPLEIVPTLVITTASLPNGRINTAYTPVTLAATGGATPYNWTATGLPAGLTLAEGTGMLSGTPTVVGQFTVHVTLNDSSDQTAYASLPLNIVSTLTILTTALPSGAIGIGYSATLLGSGGSQPFTWVATGLPPGLSLNASTGLVSGTPTQTGGFSVNVTLTDASGQTARAAFGVTVGSPPPSSMQITTTSLPNGTVGVYYAAQITVSGGTGPPYTFIVTSGSSGGTGLPPGLQLSNSGQLQGTPTTAGSFSFGVTASDPANNSASATISITIVPAPLVITTAGLSSVQVGSSVGITFAATGGVPPLVFTLSGTAPTGTTFSAGTLSGTATTVGSYSFTVTVTDSAKNTASKGFTLVVTPAALTITTASLPSGQVGAAYAGQFAAVGGAPPYVWSGSAGGGLSVSSGGAVSGTPTTAGMFTVSVTVTDSAGTKATGNFSVTVNPSSLLVTTSVLPGGALGSSFSASLTATGGTPPYTWTGSGLPNGVTLSSSGALSGTPTSPGQFTVTVTVKDAAGVTATASFSVTIAAAPLKITTTGISPPTLGTSFSLAFGATGGTPPFMWNATGLPSGVTISSTGTLSGTPAALGTSSITVTVKDSGGLTASETLNLTVALPAAPTLNITGLPSTANPGTQSTATVTFSATYPVDVTVNLTLTFAPLSGADDPNIQFSTGGRTATLTIKAGSTNSSATIGVQTGTVAGTITITTQLLGAGQDITPVPAPTKTILISPAAPSITSVTAAVNGTGFTVTIDGFDPTRAVTQVVFTFAAAAGSTLQTTTVTVSAASLYTTWYQSSASVPFGSQFSFTIPFTVAGNVQSLTSVTVTLVNPTGTSTAMSATL